MYVIQCNVGAHTHNIVGELTSPICVVRLRVPFRLLKSKYCFFKAKVCMVYSDLAQF